MTDTYYLPSGREHLRQTANPEAEEIVAQRLLAGDHVHIWAKDDGLRCMQPDGTDVKVPRLEKCEREKNE